jgi:hypothetical protein
VTPGTKRFTRTAAAFVAAAVTAMVALVAPVSASANPADATATPPECTPLAIVAFRGDGENPAGVDALDDPFSIITNPSGWEGATIHRALRAYESIANPMSVESVPVIAIGDETDPETIATGFPAKTLFADGAILAPVLLNSAARGVEEGSARMTAMWASADPSCARTQFIVLGYSQGAIAARALSEIYPADVAGTILFADPLQLGDSDGNEGTGSSGNGAVRTGLIPSAQEDADRFYALPFHQSSLCHDEDPVCNFDLWRLIQASYSEPSAHMDYVDSITEASAKGSELASLVSEVLGAPALARDTPPMDILFVMNLYSGRSGGNLERHFLVQSMDSLSDYLETNPNTRVGVRVLGYIGLEPTSDIATIVDFIRTVPDTYNEYPRQYPHQPIEWAIDDPAFFRPGADQVIIGVKQYASNQPDFEAIMQAAITEKATTVRPASVSERGQTMAGVTTRIFNAPGAGDPDDGFYQEGYAQTSPFEAIYEKVFHNTRAVIGYPSTIIAGQTVTLSSEGSTGVDHSSLFRVGLSNTGGLSSSTADGSSSGSLTVTTPGQQNVSLTVTSSNGDTSTVEALVNVLDPDDLVIPVSPATGAPASDASFTPSVLLPRTGGVTVTLPAGGLAQVSLLAVPAAGVDPFVAPGQIQVGQVAASSAGGPTTGAVVVPSSVPTGSYLLLVRESDGKMVAIPVTV